MLTPDILDNIVSLADRWSKLNMSLFPTLTWADIFQLKHICEPPVPLIFYMQFSYGRRTKGQCGKL